MTHRRMADKGEIVEALRHLANGIESGNLGYLTAIFNGDTTVATRTMTLTWIEMDDAIPIAFVKGSEWDAMQSDTRDALVTMFEAIAHAAL